MLIPRRSFLGSIASVAAAWHTLTLAQSGPQSPRDGTGPAGGRIVLLGTAGGPPPHIGRSQPATLLQVEGRNYLIDAGENCGQQLMRAGCPPRQIDQAFLSHLHWDHTLGLDYLMAIGWMTGRRQPMPIWGPPGTRELVEKTVAATGVGEDIFRAQTADYPPLGSLYPSRVVDPAKPQIILEDDAVRISAAPTSHFAGIHAPPHSYGLDKALAWRFDTPHGSVTITGDTGPSPSVEELGEGSDVLVSEICDLDSISAALAATARPGQDIASLVEHMRSQHLSPEELGRMASRSGVKTLVLTHFVMGQGFQPAAFVPKLTPFFSGRIVVGEDLLSIPLGPQA